MNLLDRYKEQLDSGFRNILQRTIPIVPSYSGWWENYFTAWQNVCSYILTSHLGEPQVLFSHKKSLDHVAIKSQWFLRFTGLHQLARTGKGCNFISGHPSCCLWIQDVFKEISKFDFSKAALLRPSIRFTKSSLHLFSSLKWVWKSYLLDEKQNEPKFP